MTKCLARNRFADGLALVFAAVAALSLPFPLAGQTPASGESTPKEALLFDFEQGGRNDYEDAQRVQFVPDHATQGKTSGKVVLDKLFALKFATDGGKNLAGQWGKFDRFAMDVFVDGGPVKATVIAWDDKSNSWDTRFNLELKLMPGQRKIDVPTGAFFRGRGIKPLDLAKLTRVVVQFEGDKAFFEKSPATVYLDNVRLVRNVDPSPVAGMKAFHFGPAQSAGVAGFVGVCKDTLYAKDKGYGWLEGGQFWKDFDMMDMLGRHRPPDDLCRSFCTPIKATFAVDLPNGDYRVWLMMAPPCTYIWHGPFKQRTVSAQGKVAVDEKFDGTSYKEYESHFQDAEDLPGDDLWQKYITWFFKPKTFDVTVSDGRLALEFDSHGESWCATVCGLAVYPKTQEAEAQKWFARLDSLRKEQYDALHVENLPAAPPPMKDLAGADQQRGYVRFVHSPDRDVDVNSVPTAEEAKTAAVEMYAAPSQYEDGCFGLYPVKDCGRMTAEVGDLAGAGGAKIAAANVELMVSRYKALNHDAIYTITPKYLDKLPKDGLDLKKGVTRSFWLVVHVPADAVAGTYKGQVKLTFADGKTDAADVVLHVWPVKLAEVDFPMGIYMMEPPMGYITYDKGGEDYWREWKNVLDDAKAHGMTSVDPMIEMPMAKGADGKNAVDFSKMDRFMELAKAAGFKQEIMGYGMKSGPGLQPDPGDDPTGKAGPEAFAKKVKDYFDQVREHAAQKKWLPICYCADDEALVHPGGTVAKLTEYFRILQASAPGIRFNATDSIVPDEKPDMIPQYEKMLAQIDTWCAGLHSPKTAELVKKAGKRLMIYNVGMNRFTFGTYTFFARKKWDVTGFFQWSYGGGATYGNTYLASYRESWFGVVYPSTHGLRPTIVWERIRAGCNDHQYLETAWNLIEKAKAAGKAAEEAKALQTVIDAKFAVLKFTKPRPEVYGGADNADNPMDPAQMDAFRKALAEGIVKLQDGLGR